METYRFWHVGSIAGRDPAMIGQIASFVAAGLLLAVVNTPGMNTLALGDDVAVALGRRVGRTRLLGVAAITLLTGAAVAACGPIAFLGLLVPHFARAISGADYRWLVPFSAVLNAILLPAADLLGRVVASDNLEVGIMPAVLGVPVFVHLVRKKGLTRI
ncbi:FecCD family ABC transporter permease [Amycolatopsis sp. TNS106]|uniref:FecCD family ABC transporter permease n=1 Tax=Amycolatopsis sp. TNS106 TaxID=2861750 RepID=UPI00351D5F32